MMPGTLREQNLLAALGSLHVALEQIQAEWPEELWEILSAVNLTSWEQAEMMILNARKKLEYP
jgi:hypothetical protein